VRRAGYVAWIGTLVEETVMSVGVALAVFFQKSFYYGNVTPVLEAIEAIRRECPIPD
jgi:hypothetical protein